MISYPFHFTSHYPRVNHTDKVGISLSRRRQDSKITTTLSLFTTHITVFYTPSTPPPKCPQQVGTAATAKPATRPRSTCAGAAKSTANATSATRIRRRDHLPSSRLGELRTCLAAIPLLPPAATKLKDKGKD